MHTLFSKMLYQKKRNNGYTSTPQHGVMPRAFSKIKLLYKCLVVPKHSLCSVKRHKNTTPCLVSGYTLIELLVVIGILTFSMGIIIVNQSGFNRSILLKNLAYEIALSVREAQVYGLAVFESQGGTDTFAAGYGVHFEQGASDYYILFADLNNNRMYDSGEGVETFQLSRNNRVLDFCATPASGVEDCSITFLDIVFERPNPDAYFRTNLGSVYGGSRITISSPSGDTQDIGILLTGQITVRGN